MSQPPVFCQYCGQSIAAADHRRCDAGRHLEPPRYCGSCARRMVVQVLPGSWTARCVEHGTRSAGSGPGGSGDGDSGDRGSGDQAH